ncbi:MAG: DUF1844 domain-containing protein [Pirellulales bacterium]|nr:DUF1844 domain-containing protein [Pirellulales bacterium]
MSDQPKPEKKKILVDEDWKNQVEAEREAPRQQQPPSNQAVEGEAAAEREAAADDAMPLPPPGLTYLVSTLYLQGMVSLGLLPDPTTDQPRVRFDQAKHAIDTLQILFDKTEGKRTPEETLEMDTVLHELRMAFVGVQQKGPAGQ